MSLGRPIMSKQLFSVSPQQGLYNVVVLSKLDAIYFHEINY